MLSEQFDYFLKLLFVQKFPPINFMSSKETKDIFSGDPDFEKTEAFSPYPIPTNSRGKQMLVTLFKF